MIKIRYSYFFIFFICTLTFTACGSIPNRAAVSTPITAAVPETASASESIAMLEEETLSNTVSTWAGSALPGFADGMNLESTFLKPYGLCVGPDGELLIVDNYANMLRLSSDGLVYTLTGNGEMLDENGRPLPGYINGSTADSLLNRPRFAAVSAEGAVIFSDTGNHCIRIIQDGTVRLLAGSGSPGYTDGPYDKAQFELPSGVAIGDDGTIYVADTLNHCIRSISPDGLVATLAGTPKQSGYQDGSVTEALFCEPNDIALGPDGALYIIDKGNQRIRRITSEEVSTVAGSGSGKDSLTGYTVGGYSDGPALEAQFQYPTGLTIAPNGTIYVADTGNHCIRTISAGTVTTLAGSRTSGNKNGSLNESRFNQPIDVILIDGGLCVSDSYNHTIRFVNLHTKGKESS